MNAEKFSVFSGTGGEKMDETPLVRAETGKRDEDGTRLAGGVLTLNVIGLIEGHYASPDGQKVTRYEELLPALADAEQNERVSGVLLLLNTVGGDVEAGLAIAEAVASMEKPTASLVLGGGHSIGIPLAVSAKKSFIVPSATMTLHPVRYSGLVIGAEQTYKTLAKMQDRILDFIVTHSRADRNTLRRLMTATDELASDLGTVLSGEEAVSVGLIDEVGGLKEALAALRLMADFPAECRPDGPGTGPPLKRS